MNIKSPKKRKKKPTAEAIRLKKAIKALIAEKNGVRIRFNSNSKPVQIKPTNIDEILEMATGVKQQLPLSNTIPTGSGFKKEIDDYHWRKGVKETPDTIKKIEEKKKRVAPLYSKGANQYITDGEDLKTLGKKV